MAKLSCRFIAAVLLAALWVACMLALPVRGAEAAAAPVPIVDLHVDLSYQANYKKRPFARGTGQYSAEDLVRAGVMGVVLPLYVPHDVSPAGPSAADLENSYSNVLGWLASIRPYQLPGCITTRGRVRTWLALEGSAPVDGIDAVRRWVARGVRLFGLVHSQDNRLASSSTGERGRSGLTAAGRRLVEQIHAAGGIVDVSHSSTSTLHDVVAMASAAGVPVVASHSNARALAEHPRNLSDSEIRAIASTGGLVAINFHSTYLTAGRAGTLDDVVRHIVHVIAVAGIEHVGIGSDFEGGIRPPSQLASVAEVQKLPPALRGAGLSDSDVRQIMGKNALRILDRPPKFRVSPAAQR